ncbi:uncharacterized protein LOC131678929 [Topomyia yanbarensis]|nr:uncharacterized protein LOC131678929 [Topomyia yanbarensis]
MNNDFAKRLLNLNLIDKKSAAQLTTYNAVCPRIYGQPKAHKDGLPLRPVVPNMTAPSYNLSKFVGQIINNSITSQYNIKDSYSFCDFINSITLPPGYVLVSLDVTALFTSIPKSLVIHDIIIRWNEIKSNTNINLDLFLEIVEFCIDSSYFKYDNKHYLQIFGTAMGNPLSPALADLIMETLLDTVTRTLNCKPAFIKKFVDDLLLAIPMDQLNHVLQTFNSYNEHIQFTYETEVDKKIPFLDLLLIRTDTQTIKSEWYIKPIASGRFLDYYSFHPLHQKLNMAQNFIQKVTHLSTNLQANEKSQIIHQQLSLNNYPRNLRNRLINRMHERNHSNILIPPANEETLQYTYRSIAYIPHLSNKIDKHLKNDYKNIRLAHHNTRTVRHLFTKLKDPVPDDQQNNIIYSIPCESCPACYIGMTTNKLKTRIYGHQTHYNALDKYKQLGLTATDPEIVALKEKTALLEHSIAQDHRFDLKNTKIIDKHNKKHALPFIEVCHIITNENSINRRTDTEGLNTIYAGIIHSLKNQNKRSIYDNNCQNTTMTPHTHTHT